MSLSNSSRLLDVRKLTTQDLIDIIKNDEFYSSCCRIIEEKDLNGQNILNLTENQILSWRTPQWLVRNLLSLKSSLSKNPEIFFQSTEDNQSVNHNSNLTNDEFKRNLNNKVATIFKPPDNKNLFLSTVPAKNEPENAYLLLDTSEKVTEPLYDEDNYLKPSVINASAKIKKGYGKPLPKPPPMTETNSIRIKEELSRTTSYADRNPRPWPRDLEENVYEPAPNETPRIDTWSISPFPSPPPEEEVNEYEAPPIYPHQFHENIHHKELSKLSNENSSKNFGSKNKSFDKLGTISKNTEIKRKNSDDSHPPPLPLRTISIKKPARENTTFSKKHSNYTNVTHNRLDGEKNSLVIDVNETVLGSIQRKYSSSSIKSESNGPFTEVSVNQKSRVSDRPLPPIPSQEKRRNSFSESKKTSSEKSMIQDDKMAEDALKFHSLRKTSFPKELIQGKENIEATILLQSDVIQGLRSKFSQQTIQRSQTTGLNSDIPEFKPITRKNDVLKKEYTLNNNDENSDLPEYINNDEVTKLSSSNSINELHLNTSMSQSKSLLSEIFKVKLRRTKSTVAKDQTPSNDVIDDNFSTEEIAKPSKSSSNTKSTLKTKLNRLQVNPRFPPNTVGTKFKQPFNKVTQIENSARDSADEDEMPVQYINTDEVRRLEFTRNNESLSKSVIQNANQLISNVMLKQTRATTPTENSYSNNENHNNLPGEINSGKTAYFKSTSTTNPTLKINNMFPHESSELMYNPRGLISKQTNVTYDNATEDEILPDYINTEELKRSFELSPTIENKQKSNIPNSNQTLISDLVAEISGVKLKPITKKKPILLNNTTDNKNIDKLDSRLPFQSDIISGTKLTNTTQNTNKVKEGIINFKTSKVKLKSTNSGNDKTENSSNDNNDENLIYSNTEELKKPDQRPSSAGLEVEADVSHQIANQSQLISSVKLKPTNYAHLNDTLAEILKQELSEKKKNLKLAVPPSALLANFDMYLDNAMVDSQENSEEDLDSFEEYDEYLYNFNNEKYFRNTDRKGAKLLLHGLEDGAFVLRPSSEEKFLLSLTVKKGHKYYNFGIFQSENHNIFCGEGSMKSPEFSSIKALLDYFENVPFVVWGGKGSEHITLKRVLPVDRF